MKVARKIFTIIFKIILSLLVFLLLYLFITFILSIIPVNTIDLDKNKATTIYIKTNGVHTDLILPIKNEAKDWSKLILFKHTIAKDSIFKYVGFGWGDKDFYLNTPHWSDLKTSTALKAACYLGSSVMHTEFYQNLNENENCKKIEVSKEEYLLLVKSISNNFKVDKKEKFILIPNQHYNKSDAFYEAKGRYCLFYTCNSWANETLKAANQKAALWTLTDFGIFYHYK